MTEPQPGVSFQPGTPSENSVFLSHGNPGESETFRLVVQARAVEDLYAVAFDLVFPGRVLEFEGATEGSHLAAEGVETTLQVAQSAPGRLVVGHSRLGRVGGVDGSGVLMELSFRVTEGGTGEIGFEDRQAFGPDGEGKSTVSWVGGTITVTR